MVSIAAFVPVLVRRLQLRQAHKLARIFYHLWTTGEDFVDAGAAAYEQQYQQRVLKHLKQRAKKIGFDLVSELIVG